MKITKKSFQSFFTRASFAGLLLVAGATAAQAQTSGSLSTIISGNYSTAPWSITSGSGTYPDGGGVATFNEQIGTTALPAVPIITVDVPITLSGLTFNSVYQYQISLGASGTLALAATGGTLNVVTSNVSSPTAFAAGDVIAAAISGGGTGGLIKTGAGVITLAGTNTYTGGTTINAGVLRISTGDAALGSTAVGNDVTINGGALRVSTTALTTARNFTLGTSGGTIELFANATINGIVSGGGSLTHTVGSTLTLTGANTYSGATTQTAGTLTVSGINGTIASSSSYDVAGIVNLDSSTASNSNRLSDTATITSRGVTINLTGNATAATAESAGALNLASGNSILTVTPNAAQPASLGFASINRQNNSTLFVRGTNLGATPANGVAQVTSTASPGTLIGGGGAAGSTTISVLPWAVGNVGAAATLGSSFVTYSGGAFRPLATTEYAAALGGNATDNVRLTAATTAATSTVNSLLFAPAGAATLSGGPITITSGAFLYSPTTSGTGTVSAGLNFGAAEGLIHTSGTLGLSGVISGSGGVTYNPFAGSVVTVTGANTYTGPTRINVGQLTFGGNIDGVTAGPLGQTSSAIILNVGSATTRLWVNADSVISRDISVQGNPAVQYTAGLGATSTFNITLNGNLDLQRRVAIENGSTLPFTINGVVSGPGSLTDAFSSLVVLNGNNTYTGGTEIQAGTYQLGSDTGFGTGTVFFTGLGTIQGTGTTARTIANSFIFNAATAIFGGTAPMNFTGAMNLNGNRTFNVTNTALTTFSGAVSSGSITKTGTGAVALNNATGNAFTGGFVNTGLAATASAVYANNTSGSAFGTGALNIGGADATTYSTLAGGFITSGPATIGGRLSPGNTPALLTPATAGTGAIGRENFTTTLTLASTSSLYLEAASLSSRDQIVVGGAFTLNGTVFVASTGGFVYGSAGPGSIDFVDWGTITVGTVAFDTSNAAVAPGYALNTSFFTTDGTIRIVAVPEPGTWAAVVGGLGVLGGMQFARRRRHRRA